MITRRSLLSSFLGATAAANVPVAEAKIVDAPAAPGDVLAVIHCETVLSGESIRRIATSWENATKGTRFVGVKLAVLDGGLTLDMIDMRTGRRL